VVVGARPTKTPKFPSSGRQLGVNAIAQGKYEIKGYLPKEKGKIKRFRYN
jgi:hypothetical protein